MFDFVANAINTWGVTNFYRSFWGGKCNAVFFLFTQKMTAQYQTLQRSMQKNKLGNPFFIIKNKHLEFDTRIFIYFPDDVMCIKYIFIIYNLRASFFMAEKFICKLWKTYFYFNQRKIYHFFTKFIVDSRSCIVIMSIVYIPILEITEWWQYFICLWKCYCKGNS